jgi:hypothetical protein
MPGLGRQPSPRRGLGSCPAEFVASVDQHAHHDQVVVDLDPDQVGITKRKLGYRVGVDRVGLAAVAGSEDPDLR